MGGVAQTPPDEAACAEDGFLLGPHGGDAAPTLAGTARVVPIAKASIVAFIFGPDASHSPDTCIIVACVAAAMVSSFGTTDSPPFALETRLPPPL